VRTHRQLVVYHSILQVLHESGCPFCKFLKEYQTARLQNRSDVETRCLCNFHTWGLAAVQDAPAAAQAFIRFAMRFGWNYHQQLKEELDQLRNEQSQDRSGWGALGRPAEFLVSQRGLRA
jgi:predicted dithiol-disulfide oxidoreductase (DUF899 family)